MSQGHILPGSPFGDLLTKYARESETIVEIGTSSGEGSTVCLALGLERPTQRMWTVELEPDLHAKAVASCFDSRITFLLGRICDGMEEFQHPRGEAMRGPMGYDYVKDLFLKAQVVLPWQLPSEIGLLLLDGGEYSSSAELDALKSRCEIIALDDTNEKLAHKNVRNRNLLIGQGWETLHEDMSDRNGYGIWRRRA